jgi:hypothetical protein
LFSLRKWFGLASAVGILSTVGLSGFMTPASAASLPSATVGMVSVTTAALPNVNIAGVPAKWSPTKLTVTPKPYTTCTKAKTVWTITNKTKKTQVLSYKVGTGAKKALGSLKAGVKAGLCSKGPAGTKETFFIMGSKSTLALTLS